MLYCYLVVCRSGKTQLAHTLCVSTQVHPPVSIFFRKHVDHGSIEAIEFEDTKKQLLSYFWLMKMQLPIHMHGGNGKVAYIDTEGTLYLWELFVKLILKSLYLFLSSPNCFLNEVFSRPERIVPIAERFGMDANAVLDNVWICMYLTFLLPISPFHD